MFFWRKWIQEPTAPLRASRQLSGNPGTDTPLPTELILQILSQSADELHIARRKLLYPVKIGSTWSSSVEQTSKELAGVSDARFHLSQVARLSRAWNSACNHILYTHLILGTSRQSHLLKRTVSNSPSLAAIVKTVLVLPKSEWGATEVQDASLVLQKLPHLEGVLIRAILPLDVPAGHPFVAELFSANILTLEIHGQLAIHGRMPPFVHLQTLTLHSFYFDWLFEFPFLPQLHTLRLIETHSWSGMHDDLPHAKLSSLRSLELYRNTFSIREFANKPKISFPGVQYLHLVGDTEIRCFEHFVGSPLMEDLHGLVLGNIETINHPFGNWIFPSTLETLSVIVDLCHGTQTLPVLEKTLRKNEGTMPTSRLHNITINVCWAPDTKPDPAKLGLEEAAFDQIRTEWRCHHPDLQFKFNAIGHLNGWTLGAS